MDGRSRLVIICNFERVIKVHLLIDYETINSGNSGSGTQGQKSQLGKSILALQFTINNVQANGLLCCFITYISL